MNTLFWLIIIYAGFGAYTTVLYHLFTKTVKEFYAPMYVFHFLLWPVIWALVVTGSIRQYKRERRNRDRIKQQNNAFTNINNNLNDYLP